MAAPTGGPRIRFARGGAGFCIQQMFARFAASAGARHCYYVSLKPCATPSLSLVGTVSMDTLAPRGQDAEQSLFQICAAAERSPDTEVLLLWDKMDVRTEAERRSVDYVMNVVGPNVMTVRITGAPIHGALTIGIDGCPDGFMERVPALTWSALDFGQSVAAKLASIRGHLRHVVPELTPRQTTFLGLVAKGMEPDRIGEIHGMDEKSVRRHLARAKDRLNARSYPEAVARAFVLGILTGEFTQGFL